MNQFSSFSPDWHPISKILFLWKVENLRFSFTFSSWFLVSTCITKIIIPNLVIYHVEGKGQWNLIKFMNIDFLIDLQPLTTKIIPSSKALKGFWFFSVYEIYVYELDYRDASFLPLHLIVKCIGQFVK